MFLAAQGVPTGGHRAVRLPFARMNKSQLVDALADRLGDRKTAATAVDALLQIVVDTVRSGDSGPSPGSVCSRAAPGRLARAATRAQGRPWRCRRRRCPRSARARGSATRSRATMPPTCRRAAAVEPAALAEAPAPPRRRRRRCVGDERLGRRRGAQRCGRPERGAHHDTARRSTRGRSTRSRPRRRSLLRKARREEGGRQEAAEAKWTAQSRPPRRTRRRAPRRTRRRARRARRASSTARRDAVIASRGRRRSRPPTTGPRAPDHPQPTP